jgi:hypothetical protein
MFSGWQHQAHLRRARFPIETVGCRPVAPFRERREQLRLRPLSEDEMGAYEAQVAECPQLLNLIEMAAGW